MIARDDHFRAAEIAEVAGNMLLELRARLFREASSPEELKATGDRVSNQVILELLAPQLAEGDAVLCEEHPDDPARLGAERVWIIDPLDGTREFSERGRDDWAVHVAMAFRGEPLVGAVALPALGLVSHTGEAPSVKPSTRGPMRVLASRTRPPEVASWVVAELGAELVQMGSAGAKAMAVARGDADAYIHAGGQFEWDSCAPVAVARAAGLHASRLDGSPLRYNRPDPYLPDLLICRREVTDDIGEALAAFRRANHADRREIVNES